MRRLNPIDAQFVDAEDQDRQASFAIATIAIFEGPAPTYERFMRAIEERLPLVPIYRKKLRTVPLRLGPPVWVDDPRFDLRYHVRQTALPPPGDDARLADLMARVMSHRLDRDYPLWEYWLVKGLSKRRWALISKVHHCMVDGVSGSDIYRVIFDGAPEPSPPARSSVPTPGPASPAQREPAARAEPSALALTAHAAAEMAALPVRQVSALASALSSPAGAVRRVAQTARAVARLAPSAWPASRSSLSGPIGRQRRYAWARVSLDDVKAVKNALGGTVNDVVLAAISGGFRSLLLARGEQPAPHMVPSLVPVSVRAAGEERMYENRLSLLMADLPVQIADPVERLAAVRTELASLKASKEAAAGEALVALGWLTPYPVASLFVRLAYQLPQREIVTVTTNVPGPSQPLYAMGRKLLEIIPYVPIATTMRIGVSIFSYCGNITFGITGDYASTPDIGTLAGGIESGIEDLLAAAG
jgi:WS/DGAT/MGAT family acyltransferase